MRKVFVSLIFLLASSFAIGQDREKPDLVTFNWQYNGRVRATIKIPPDYRYEETEHYGEGIVTHIRYADGSAIILQKGAMYLAPMLQEPKYLLDETVVLSDRRIRRGKLKGSESYWREDNLSRNFKVFYSHFPNIAFEKVPKTRVKLFEKALDSFVITRSAK